MKNTFLFFFFITFFTTTGHSQNVPAIEWQKCLGGTDNEKAYSMQQTNDSGFIIAGYAASADGDVTTHYGGHDYWILKLDTDGNMLWQKTFGGSQDDEARSIQQTADSGFIVAGYSASNDSDVSGNHGGTDYWIVKLDLLGNLEWQKSLGGTQNDSAFSIQQAADGGFIVAGSSTSGDGDVTGHHGSAFLADIWVVKLDASGNIVKQKSLGGGNADYGRCIRQTSDSGFILIGFTNSTSGNVSGNHGGNDYWMVKLSPLINIEWQKCLGGSGTDEGESLEETEDGEFIVTGTSDSNDGDVSGNHYTWLGSEADSKDIWTIRLTNTGDIMWEKSFGGSLVDHASAFQQTVDKGFLIAGISFSNGWDVSGNKGNGDGWILKLDSSGNIMWQQTIGGTGSDITSSIVETSGGEIIVAGSSDSNDGNVSGNHGLQDYWIAKLSCNVPQVFYQDADVDGFGNVDASVTATVCTPPLGYVTDSTDCNDANIVIHPSSSPSVLWQKCLGGTQFNGDNATAIEQTSDGGYIMTGTTWSDDGDVSGNKGESDYWVVKMDEAGNIQWQKCLGGSYYEEAYSIHQTTDSGYIIAGRASSTDGDVTGHHGTATNDDIWLVKLDDSGNIQWEKCLGGSEYEWDGHARQTTDGGYIVIGTSGSNDGDVSGHHGQVSYPDLWVVKLDAVGTILWQKSLGGFDTEYGKDMVIAADGSYFIIGSTASNNGDVSGNHGYFDYWVVNLDTSGNVLWQKCYGGTDDDEASSISRTTDDGFIVGGATTSVNGDVIGNHGGGDEWIVKLESNGNLLWQKCLGGNGFDGAHAIRTMAEGGFIIAGSSESQDGDVAGNHGAFDSWIVKLSLSGNVEWEERCLGGEGTDIPTSIDQTDDGGFIVAGFTDSQYGDVSGNHGLSLDCWVVRFSPAPGTEIVNGIDDDCDGNIDGIILGTSSIDYAEPALSVFPNPTSGMVTITGTFSKNEFVLIRVLDLTGRELYSKNFGKVSENFSKQIDLSMLPTGIYFLRIIHNGISEIKKLEIVQRP